MDICPWDRRPHESAKAYNAFLQFRNQPLEKRSLTAVASTLRKSLQLIWRWSKRNDWRERVDAWDRDQDERLRNEVTGGRAAMVKRHVHMAFEVQQRLLDRINALSKEEMQSLPVGLAAKLFVEFAKFERLSRGEPDQDHAAKIIFEVICASDVQPSDKGNA
jgi:hypothetical protein